ncbi:hypothetical protein Emed_002826 [Eimeria media]
MVGLARSVYRWCFHVSDPKDPKLQGWLHPLFALALNLGLSFTVALLFFLSTPSVFQDMWLRQQPAAVLNAITHACKLLNSLGFSGTATVQWLQDNLGSLLLPDFSFLDKKQVFTLYSWEDAIVKPQFLAAFLLAYVLIMMGSRLYEKGPVMLYDMAWACNMSMVLAAAAIWLNIPLLVSACSCWVAVDQLLWYADTLAFLIRGRFLIGLAKYMANKDTVSMQADAVYIHLNVDVVFHF